MRFHTDLACELTTESPAEGIRIEESKEADAQITIVHVETEEGAHNLGKPIGAYITVFSEFLCKNDPKAQKSLSLTLSRHLAPLLPKIGKDETVLILGLGNHAITPDALGNKTAKNVLVTRHILQNLPDFLDERVKSVCALAPGVLGVTGLETGEVALGIVQTVHPACVIAVDSLCARSPERVLTTVQLSDSGICPGSGLNNPRRELTQKTLGVPVIAIGVPLVVSTLSICLSALENIGGVKANPEAIQKSLGAAVAQMVVTPKEIDEAVDHAASVIAMAINLAVHNQIDYEEFAHLI